MSLPAELWALVFSKVTSREGILHLWLFARFVSKTFKYEIERLKLRRPTLLFTKVIFDMSTHRIEGMGCHDFRNLTFAFRH